MLEGRRGGGSLLIQISETDASERPEACGFDKELRLLVQLDHLRRADHSHERSGPLRHLRSDAACWPTTAPRTIHIRRGERPETLNLTRVISSP